MTAGRGGVRAAAMRALVRRVLRGGGVEGVAALATCVRLHIALNGIGAVRLHAAAAKGTEHRLIDVSFDPHQVAAAFAFEVFMFHHSPPDYFELHKG